MSNQSKLNKVFITKEIPATALDLLKASGKALTIWPMEKPLDSDTLIEQCLDHQALICVGHQKLDREVLEGLNHLDVIAQFGAGYDNIDIEAASDSGILVCNAPFAMNQATADVAFGLMIATSRKMFYMHKRIINNEWGGFQPMANLGFELKNKTLGVFGLGRIGIELAKRCQGAYQMDVIYHNRNRNKEAEQLLNAKWVSFDELLSESDIVSVHCALTAETQGLFDREAFAKMKSTALFINTSRGKVHNEPDLIKALEEGEIWGAGLDVSDPEPMKSDNALLSMENVSVLPHIGSATWEARTEMARLCAQNIIQFYTNEVVKHAINADRVKSRL
ncbi:MAG: D-glycerate dehydrogenase [Cyclobacteriaceae bacterium]